MRAKAWYAKALRVNKMDAKALRVKTRCAKALRAKVLRARGGCHYLYFRQSLARPRDSVNSAIRKFQTN